jgi:hypothetical protein
VQNDDCEFERVVESIIPEFVEEPRSSVKHSKDDNTVGRMRPKPSSKSVGC